MAQLLAQEQNLAFRMYCYSVTAKFMGHFMILQLSNKINYIVLWVYHISFAVFYVYEIFNLGNNLFSFQISVYPFCLIDQFLLRLSGFSQPHVQRDNRFQASFGFPLPLWSKQLT